MHPATIQPVILVGGASRRFGRDKLREPIPTDAGGGWLIDRPIAALRLALGPPIALVGDCDPRIAARADTQLPDPYPGAGPIGGILSALERTGRPVFILPGDLPLITADDIRSILAAALAAPEAWALLAHTDRIEPCIGLYRPPAADALRGQLSRSPRPPLADAIPAAHRLTVPIDPRHAANANTPEELRRILRN